jgi:hypothetical protein
MLSGKSSIVSFQPSRRCLGLLFAELSFLRAMKSWAAAYGEDDALSAYKAVGHP